MSNLMPCGLEDDRIRFEPDNLDHARAVEDYADNLMDECVTLAGADAINKAHDLYDGILLPQMMQLIALWSGSQSFGERNAVTQMRELYNLLANALQTVAEGEVSK